MQSTNEGLEVIRDMKSLMERSSRFISLSGLGGVFSGCFALIGAYLAHWRTNQSMWIQRETDSELGTGAILSVDWSVVGFLLIDAAVVLILSLLVSYYFSRKKALKQGQPLWGKHSRLMLVNLMIPLLAGGLFCVILFYHGLIGLIAPTTLIFYGLALINAGKYSFEEVSYLGVSEILVGLVALMLKGQGLIFWAVGFGALHIVYGILMYWKHDR